MGADSEMDLKTKEHLIADVLRVLDPPPFDRAKLAEIVHRRLQNSATSATRPYATSNRSGFENSILEGEVKSKAAREAQIKERRQVSGNSLSARHNDTLLMFPFVLLTALRGSWKRICQKFCTTNCRGSMAKCQRTWENSIALCPAQRGTRKS